MISKRENSRQQKRHYTHHPLNFHFCHLFSYYHHKISSCSQPFHYGQLFSYFQHLHFRHRPLFSFHCPTTFTGSTCKRNFSQDQQARGTSHRINMQEELFTGSTCMRNFSLEQHPRGTFHRIYMHQELLTGSTCTRNFSQDQHARGTHFRINMHENFSRDQHARGTSHWINMQEELLTGSTCKRNFSQDQHTPGTIHSIKMQEELLTGSTCTRNFSQYQHARGTSHRINMQEELLTESTCKKTFWSAYGCFSLDVKLYRSLSLSPILLLWIFPFCHYCQLFSYYSILFTSVVNCLEPWIYAWLSLFQTTHDLRFKDLGRCLWLKWGDSKQHIYVPEMVLKTLQPTVCALKGYQWYHDKSEGKLKTAEETLHSSSP